MSLIELKGKSVRGVTIAGCLALVTFVALGWFGFGSRQSETLQNLQTAYNGEANAHARYLAFADQAQHEEFYDVASLFRAAAYAEHIHLERIATVIRKMGAEPASKMEVLSVKTTAENLRASADKGEAYERDVLYPAFIAQAEAEGNHDAAQVFQYARTAEAQHYRLFKAAVENLKHTGVESRTYFVCKTCGFTAEQPVEPCPGCSDSDAAYTKIY